MIWPVVTASFLASLVEFVEALTIILAVGVVRGWKSALLGVQKLRILIKILIYKELVIACSIKYNRGYVQESE